MIRRTGHNLSVRQQLSHESFTIHFPPHELPPTSGHRSGLSLTDMQHRFVFSTRLRQNIVILTVRPEYLGKYLALYATSNARGVQVERTR
jgi:hypothetical protein